MSKKSFRISVMTKEIAEIAKLLGYRKRNTDLIFCEEMTVKNVNWDEGSRSEYTFINLEDLDYHKPDLSRDHPDSNPAEGAVIRLQPNFVVAQTGTFMGKPSKLYLYVHPANAPKMVGMRVDFSE